MATVLRGWPPIQGCYPWSCTSSIIPMGWGLSTSISKDSYMAENTEVKRKAIVYIDGFNLYFAISERGWRDLLWLDLVELARRLINPVKQELVAVKYFTSPIKGPADKRLRQTTYLNSLETTKPT